MTTETFRMTERDLDLILLEELHGDVGFCNWFAERVNLPGAQFLSARHSVSAKANAKWGETDILLFLKQDEQIHAILIEDKLAADFTEKQAERYHERALELLVSGQAAAYTTVLCAPKSYLRAVPSDDPWHTRISLEDIRDWFGDSELPHAKWRANALTDCLKRLSHAKSAGSEEIRIFSMGLKKYLNCLSDRPFDHNITGDSWGFIIKTSQTPAHVQLAWKNGKGRLDLTFSGRHVGKASQIPAPEGISRQLADGARLKSDIFGIDVPIADVTQPFPTQLDVVNQVMKEAGTLLELVPRVIGDW